MPTLNAPTSLNFSAFYALGDFDGYCNVKWTSPSQSVEVFYRVDYHVIGTDGSVYVWLTDVPAGMGDTYGVPVKFATIPPLSDITETVDTIRITAMDPSGAYDSASASISTPTPPLTLTYSKATNFNVVCNGKIGDAKGSVDITWTDLTKFVTNGVITLSKYGTTSPAVNRVLYQNAFFGIPSEFGPNRIHIDFDLLPPGIQLLKNTSISPSGLAWDPFNPQSRDPRSPFWVVEQDLLTLRLEINSECDSVNTSNPIISEFTFTYYREAMIQEISDSAVVSLNFEKILAIAQDPNIPFTADASIAYISGLPSGLSFNPSLKKISGAPTTLGTFEVLFDVTSVGGKTDLQSGTLFVTRQLDNPAGAWPTIVAPPPQIALIRGEEYPQEFNLQGQGDGVYVQTSGTLPDGITVDLTTGIFSGAPTTLQDPSAVIFQKHGPVNLGPEYTISFSVIEAHPPNIIPHGP